MISDTLAEAVETIRTYLADYPSTYASEAGELGALVALMEEVRDRLDRAPLPKTPPDEHTCSCGATLANVAGLFYHLKLCPVCHLEWLNDVYDAIDEDCRPPISVGIVEGPSNAPSRN